jgi:imidazolonepropionase-like amidohydrolase
MTRLLKGRGTVAGGVAMQAEPGVGVLLDGPVIREVGPVEELEGAANTIDDLGEVFLLPALVDAHTHVTCRHDDGDIRAQEALPAVEQTIRSIPNLRDMVRSGVATARVMSEAHEIDLHLRTAISRGVLVGPELHVSGLGFGGPGPDGRSPHELQQAVRDLATRGVDHIKVYASGRLSMGQTMRDPNYSADQMSAIVDAATESGLTVGAHAHGGAAVDHAVRAGVTSIEHGSLLTEDQIGSMADQGTWLVLTTSAMFHERDSSTSSTPTELLEARKNMEEFGSLLREAGVKVAVGTDAMHGHIADEVRWMAEHGWSVAEAIGAATVAGAQLLGLDDRLGLLAPGMQGDVLAVRGDVMTDLGALERVEGVWKAGRPLWRAGCGFAG